MIIGPRSEDLGGSFYGGHGTASQADFEELLKGAGVTSLVDVRLGPGSGKHPHFGKDSMGAWLPETGITYRWEQRVRDKPPQPGKPDP